MVLLSTDNNVAFTFLFLFFIIINPVRSSPDNHNVMKIYSARINTNTLGIRTIERDREGA